MEKDLIIGAASGYDWDKIKYWVNSIAKSGFKGDVVLVGTNMNKSTIDKLTERGVKLSLFGKVTESGDVVAHSQGAPHVERFFYLSNYLDSIQEHYRYVITTDTRDVVFQKNPSDWLENALVFHSLVASSEGLKYINEPWGNQNLIESFGPFFHNKLKDHLIYNVGVVAGDLESVKSLLLLIFQLSINRPIPIVDQAVYNFILSIHPFDKDTMFTSNDDGWAINLGTSVNAVRAGSGDLGARCKDNIPALNKYLSTYEDTQPTITKNGIVSNKYDLPFNIVHQWDRVPELNKLFEELYGD